MEQADIPRTEASLRADGTFPSRSFASRLLTWFSRCKRSLPWRRDYSPYSVWIAEIMLQQTQVTTVVPYYLRWMERLPTVHDVAAVDVDEILKLWEGLGYYYRARNIHRAALRLVADYQGRLPDDYRELLKLPGIGSYSAGAIMSLAFNRPYAAVDGNVKRVFARLFDLDRPLGDKAVKAFVERRARALIPAGKARLFNQALMELGALQCGPRTPACPSCPVGFCCLARKRGVVGLRPVRGKSAMLENIEVAVGVLHHRGRVLIQKRPPTGLMAGLWEFPGGKVEPGESPESAVCREFLEELQLAVVPTGRLATIRHSYTRYRVRLHAFHCRPAAREVEPVLLSAVEYRWVKTAELDRFAFPAANKRLIAMLHGR